MDTETFKRRILDEEHLRLLALFHYISGGLTIAFSGLFSLQLLFLRFMAARPEMFTHNNGASAEPPVEVIGLMTTLFSGLVIIGITYGIAQIVSGRFIQRRRFRLLSIIIAAPNLVFIPYGTLFGVMTVLVLTRDSVSELYAS